MITDISKDITKCEIYPGDPGTELKRVQKIENGDLCNLSLIETGLHNGTHADAPLHFIDGGNSIDKADLSRFIGFCTVIEVPDAGAISVDFVNENFSSDAKRIILKSGGKAWFSKESAKAAAEKGVILIGTDALSIGSPEDQTGPHREILGKNIAVIENLELENVKPGRYFLVAQPLKIGSAEAAPLRAVLIDDIAGYIKNEMSDIL